MGNDNSTGNSTIDNLMDSVYGSGSGQPQSNPTPPATAGQRISPQQLIGGLLQMVGQGANAAGNFINPQQTPPQQMPQLNPDQQKGVQQAVKAKQKSDQQQGLQWGTQAIQQGANPQDLLNHPAMTGGATPMQGGQVLPQMNPQQQQALKGILPQGQQSPQQQISSNNQQTALNVSKQNLQESEPKNFFQRWEQQFQKVSGGMTQADRETNMQSMQKVAGAEPISPTEAAKMNVDVKKAAIEGASKLLDTDTSTASSLTQAIAVLQQTKGPVATALHQSSPEIDSKMDDLKGVVGRIKNHSENMATLLDSVSKSSIKSGSQTQKNLVGKITGTTSSGVNYSVQ